MEFQIKQFNGVPLAEVLSNEVVLFKTEDALDLIGNCHYQGATKIIIREENITPDFFDLKTKIAGDILQKFSTYAMQLAIVGNFTKYQSKSLNDFIYESNKQGRILFVPSIEEAQVKLTGTK